MSEKKILRVGGVPEHFNLPWHHALAANAFAHLDLDVEFVEYPGGTGAMASAMNDGDLDVALMLFEGAVTNILRGNPNRIVKVYVDSPLVWGIHVASKSEIQRIDEIYGKVYAISRAGSGSHLIAIVDAAERDWPTDNMKFSKVENLAGAREKLANGKVDVFLWEKFTTQPLIDAGEFRRVGERVVPWAAFVVSVRNSILKSFAPTIKTILGIVDRYCIEFKNNPNAVEIVANKFDIKLADSAGWVEQVRWNEGFDCPQQTVTTIVRYLNQLNIIDNQSADYNDVWFQL